ncbi:MAG: hypothetical protein MJ100_04860 [Ruminococcus sp.]|nr:hypothetical protein [Ruminococcus sp.]
MKIREIIRYTKKLLRGRRVRTCLICFLPLCAELFFRSAEAAVYSLLLYFGEISPLSVFGTDSPIQPAASLIFTLLRWIVTAPLGYAAAFRLSEICSEAPKITRFSEILISRTAFRRSLGALLFTKLFSLIALAPAVFFGISAYSILHGTLGTNGVFNAANLIVMTFVCIIAWLSLKLSFSAVPFLMVKMPQKSSLRVVLHSIKFMNGRKSIIFRLGIIYILPALSVVGLPFAVTRFMTAFTLCTDIFNREDEYNKRINSESRTRKSRHAPELSHRKKRRFKAASH